MYIPIGALLIVVLTVLGVSSFLRIMVIEVEGTTRYTADDIIYASGLSKGDNLLFLDTEGIEQRIISAMPFVNSATISRVVPDGIIIEVEESAPIAAIYTRDGMIILDSGVRILEIRGARVPGLIEVIGITPIDAEVGGQLRGEEARAVQYLRELLRILEAEGMAEDVSDIDISNLARIEFWYLDRFRVRLGEPNYLQEKINWITSPGTIGQINRDRGADAMGLLDVSNHIEFPRFTPTS